MMQFDRLCNGWVFALLTCFLPQLCIASPIADSRAEKRVAGPQVAPAAASPDSSDATASLPSTVPVPQPAVPFFYFPNNDQAENIKPRLNGQILVTINTSPVLYQIDPFRTQVGGIIHTFHGYTSLFGIVELQPDVFYLIAGNYTGAPDYYGFQGTFSIFEVDLSNLNDVSNTNTIDTSSMRVTKIVDVPQAQLLDGLIVVNPSLGLLMTGDAQTGTLYLINIPHRTATAVLSSPLLAGLDDTPASSLEHVGINGMKLHGSDLYFDNTAKYTYGIVPLNLATGHPSGPPAILATYASFLDDLSFDYKGNQFISEPLDGILLRQAGSNATSLFTPLYGANSNAFGRTILDFCVLYTTFDGAPSGVAKVDAGLDGYCGSL